MIDGNRRLMCDLHNLHSAIRFYGTLNLHNEGGNLMPTKLFHLCIEVYDVHVSNK